MARRKIRIDLDELEKLCVMQCTEEEIASFLGVSVKTIIRRRKIPKFAELMDQAKAKGRVSVRRNLFRLASNGNIAAAIFLAKNILGYRDAVNTEVSGPAGGPIQFGSKPDLSQLSDEELRQLRTFADKTLPARRD